MVDVIMWICDAQFNTVTAVSHFSDKWGASLW